MARFFTTMGLVSLLLTGCSTFAWEEDWVSVSPAHLKGPSYCEDRRADVTFYHEFTRAQEWREPVPGEAVHYKGIRGPFIGPAYTISGNVLDMRGFNTTTGARVMLTSARAVRGDSGSVVRGVDGVAVGIVTHAIGYDGNDGWMAMVPTGTLRRVFEECNDRTWTVNSG